MSTAARLERTIRNKAAVFPVGVWEHSTDIVLLVVLWRLRCKLSLRDLAEMFLPRGVVFTHGVKQRYSPMRGFGNVAAAGRFYRAYEEQHQSFRARTTISGTAGWRC